METIYNPRTDELRLTLGQGGEAPHGREGERLSLRLEIQGDRATLVMAPLREGWLPFLQSLAVGGGMEEPPWHAVRSSMIGAVRYDERHGILEVAFNKGIYLYFGVPREVFEGLLRAESKGRYMRQHIIDRYPWIRRSRLRLSLAQAERPGPERPDPSRAWRADQTTACPEGAPPC